MIDPLFDYIFNPDDIDPGDWHFAAAIFGDCPSYTQSTPRKRVHRYSRRYRFRCTLAQLQGTHGDFPLTDLKTFASFTSIKNLDRAWNSARKSLKRFATTPRAYYLKIPRIIEYCGGPKWKITDHTFQEVMSSFDRLESLFTMHRNKLDRKYFPPMHYICLKLLEYHGSPPPYFIPLARTSRKRKSLGEFYERLDSSTILIDECTRRKEKFLRKSWYSK